MINKQGISILEWNKILNYSVQHCHWDNIESISHSQHSLGDKIFNKGEVSIILDHGLHHRFQDISNPKQVAGLLRDNKVQFETKQATNLNTPDREHDHQHNEKFDILVETLGEVIKEYMDKDKTKNIPDRW